MQPINDLEMMWKLTAHKRQNMKECADCLSRGEIADLLSQEKPSRKQYVEYFNLVSRYDIEHYRHHPFLSTLKEFYEPDEGEWRTFSPVEQQNLRSVYQNINIPWMMALALAQAMHTKFLLPAKKILKRYSPDQLNIHAYYPILADALEWEQGFQFLLDAGFNPKERGKADNNLYYYASRIGLLEAFQRIRSTGLPLIGRSGYWNIYFPSSIGWNPRLYDGELLKNTECMFQLFDLGLSLQTDWITTRAAMDAFRYRVYILTRCRFSKPLCAIPQEIFKLIINFLRPSVI